MKLRNSEILCYQPYRRSVVALRPNQTGKRGTGQCRIDVIHQTFTIVRNTVAVIEQKEIIKRILEVEQVTQRGISKRDLHVLEAGLTNIVEEAGNPTEQAGESCSAHVVEVRNVCEVRRAWHRDNNIAKIAKVRNTHSQSGIWRGRNTQERGRQGKLKVCGT